MGIFRPDWKAYAFLAKLSNIAILNFWFVLCSLPVFTFGASLSAMYASAYKLAEGTENTVTRDFFAAFRANFGQSTKMWLIQAAAGGLLGAEIWFWYIRRASQGGMADAMLVVGVCLLVVWLLEMLYGFAMQARFENTLKNTMRNALLFAYRNPLATCLQAAVFAAGVWLNTTIVFANIAFLVYGFGCFGYLSARLHLAVFARQESRRAALADGEKAAAANAGMPASAKKQCTARILNG